MMFIHNVSGHTAIGNSLCYKNSHKNQHSMHFKRDEPSRPDYVCSVLPIFLKLSSQTLGLADMAQSPIFQASHSVPGMSATHQHMRNPQSHTTSTFLQTLSNVQGQGHTVHAVPHTVLQPRSNPCSTSATTQPSQLKLRFLQNLTTRTDDCRKAAKQQLDPGESPG